MPGKEALSEGLQQLLEVVREAKRQAEKEWGETDTLIRQSSGEMELLVQRNAQAAGRLRQVQANPDSVPRDQLGEIIATAQEVQGRLFTMKGRLEQLRARREVLDQYRKNLEKILASLEALASLGIPQESEASPPGGIAMVIRVQEEERQRLARQMHDGPAQSLTNLILQAEICERLFDRDQAQAKEELARLREEAARTFNRIRSFIFDLRPMILDDLGLFPTLRRYVKALQEERGIAIELSVTGEERRLPPHTEVTLFRIIQEALKNAVEHANATKVQVSLSFQGEVVSATVKDDGKGFDVGAVLASAEGRKTVGLTAMQGLATTLGGSVHFDSGPGRGTAVTVEVPVD